MLGDPPETFPLPDRSTARHDCGLDVGYRHHRYLLWKGFLALVAGVDLFSRGVHGRMLSNSLHKQFSLDALEAGGQASQ